MKYTTKEIIDELFDELKDVELSKNAAKIVCKWVLKELDDHFQGFASTDRVVRWENILNELNNSNTDKVK